MRKIFPPNELARDERFVRTKIEDRVFDPRNAAMLERDLGSAKLEPSRPAAADRARARDHGGGTGLPAGRLRLR